NLRAAQRDVPKSPLFGGRLMPSAGIPLRPSFVRSIHARVARPRGDRVRRRQFITLLGGAAAAWPLAARAPPPTMPVVGYLDTRSPESVADRLRGLRRGLQESGYIEKYRWGENQSDRLQELATDLVRRHVAVIATSGPPAHIRGQGRNYHDPHRLFGRQ